MEMPVLVRNVSHSKRETSKILRCPQNEINQGDGIQRYKSMITLNIR